ncbi:cupin domain-containing protein [Thermosipho ferrireducens]|uniref:Cupin domain-containing protein n=1 Tax=Thermosipho ferrireducens TaxID=2571116 RepID=A0ABX7S5F4_9BACT|nr:cupin domain-containing protein [Thermosipho ferrireducens]QTA37764.1 cupin domain-containing protein [Thermosipho ferrireducens]
MINVYSYRGKEPILSNEKVVGTRFFENDSIQMVHIKLKPEALLHAHKSDVDAILYVLSGIVEVEINGELARLEKNEMIEFPKNILHSVKNVGSDEAEVLVIKILG